MCRYSLLLEFFCAAGCTPEIRFSSAVVQGIYMHVCACTKPITISQLTSGERSNRSWGDKYWLLAFLRLFCILPQTFNLQLNTSKSKQTKILLGSESHAGYFSTCSCNKGLVFK